MTKKIALVPKRGHHSDFAMTREEIDALIKCTPSQTTREMIHWLASGTSVTAVGNAYGVSRVAVWRRVKRALERAVSYNILSFPVEKIPYPSALSLIREEIPLQERLKLAAQGENVPKHIRVLLTQAAERIADER